MPRRDPGSIGKGLLRRFFIAAERQIHDHDRPVRSAHHGRAMRDHHVQRHLHGGIQAINHLPQRIADQQHIAMLVEDLRHAGRIGGQHDDGFAILAFGDGGHG
jgi:hypothetical protein